MKNKKETDDGEKNKNELRIAVADALSAKAMGNGILAVYAPPAMVALMEQIAA